MPSKYQPRSVRGQIAVQCTSIIYHLHGKHECRIRRLLPESMIHSHLVVELGMETSMGRTNSSLASCKGCMLFATIQKFMLAKKQVSPCSSFLVCQDDHKVCYMLLMSFYSISCHIVHHIQCTPHLINDTTYQEGNIRLVNSSKMYLITRVRVVSQQSQRFVHIQTNVFIKIKYMNTAWLQKVSFSSLSVGSCINEEGGYLLLTQLEKQLC